MSFIERFKGKWKAKSTGSKIGDILFWVFIVVLIVPQTRAMVLEQVNSVKGLIFKPKQLKGADVKPLSDKDYIWKLSKLDGNDLYLTDFKGKVIFINKWATWCPPCVAEMPSIERLYDKYKDNSSIEFVIVSNETTEKVSAFIKKRAFTFPTYTSQYASPDVFESSAIPATFIVSKSGKIVLKEEGSADWSSSAVDKIIKGLLAE